MTADEAVRRRDSRVVTVAALAALTFGVLVRFVGFTSAQAEWDPAWFRVMADSFLIHHEFIEPWSGAYTHHYPPLFPLVLAAFRALLGKTDLAADTAGLVVGLALIAVVYATTRDLFGPHSAVIASAFVSAFPFFALFERLGYSESLATLFFVVTLWAILKSLARPPFILLAGLFAGLGYLTKSSMGPFFIVAGLGGFAWRFAYVRLAVFRDRWYMAAAGIFLALVGAWTARNVAHFGLAGWETQPYASDALRTTFFHEAWLSVFAAKVAFALLFLLVGCAPVADGIVAAARRWREPATSALLLAATLPVFIALFFMTAFTFTEHRPTFADITEVRYLLPSLVPLWWLGLANTESARLPAGSTRPYSPGRTALKGIALVIAAVPLALALVAHDDASGFRAALVVTTLASVFAILLTPPEARPGPKSVRASAVLALGLLALLIVSAGTAWLAALLVFAAFVLALPLPSSRIAAGVALISLGALAFGGAAFPYAAAVGHAAALAGPGGAIAADSQTVQFVSAEAPTHPVDNTLARARVLFTATHVTCAGPLGPMTAPSGPRLPDGRNFTVDSIYPLVETRVPFDGISKWLVANILRDPPFVAPSCLTERQPPALVVYSAGP
ncbi:MAG: glycosyltransferase family 39 protein [Thermoplasmatota archaeon]